MHRTLYDRHWAALGFSLKSSEGFSMHRTAGALLGLLLFPALGLAPFAQAAERPSILLMIGDDLGTDTLSCYEASVDPAATPSLDRLCREGVRFDNVWSMPTCSPARASMLTGRYPFRTGIVGPIVSDSMLDAAYPKPPDDAPKHLRYLFTERLPPELVKRNAKGLALQEKTLPQVLSELGYRTGAFGKWHLDYSGNGGLRHPNKAGFQHYSGFPSGGVRNYYATPIVVNGEIREDRRYQTSALAEDAAAWIAEQGGAPWFAWVAFQAPHTPFHLPPKELLSSKAAALDPDGLTKDNTRPYYLAMIEAMDTAIGRLLAAISDAVLANTLVLFIGDNGSPPEVRNLVPYAADRVKGTVYQGGVLAPFIAQGAGVAGGRSHQGLVSVTDLFATIVELAGGDADQATAEDSISFAAALSGDEERGIPTRKQAFTEVHARLPFPGGPPRRMDAHALRDQRYKLIRVNGAEELYDLIADPLETANLLASEPSAQAKAAHARLSQELDALLGSEHEVLDSAGFDLPAPTLPDATTGRN